MQTQALCHPLTRNADEVDEHKMLALLHLQVTNTIQKSSCSSRALPLSKMFVLCLYYFVRNCFLPFCSYIFKTNEATARTTLKQAEVQPRPNEYPQTLLIATLLPSVKTDIDTSKRIAEKRKMLWMSIPLRQGIVYSNILKYLFAPVLFPVKKYTAIKSILTEKLNPRFTKHANLCHALCFVARRIISFKAAKLV